MNSRREMRNRKRNAVRLQFEPLESRLPLAANLVLTEFVASNSESLLDANGESSDWMEIFNAGDEPASLSDYFLTDDTADNTKWRFPAGQLAAGEFLIVFASGNNETDANGNLHTNFRLSAGGETLRLTTNNGQTVLSEYQFSQQFTDVAFGIGQQATESRLVTPDSQAYALIPTAVDQEERAVSWTTDDLSPLPNVSSVTAAIGFGEGDIRTQNIAVGAQAVASGPLWPGFVPERIVDGDRTTISHPASPVRTFEYSINLGEETAFDRIEIYNRADGCCPERLTNYRVSIHDDDEGEIGPAVWSADIRTDGSNSGARGVDIITPILDPTGDFGGQHIVIAKIEENSTNYWPQIAEVEVYPATGYGDLFTTNIQTPLQNINSSVWLQIPFEVPDASQVDQLELSLQYDDGFVAYLNGTEFARRNAPDQLTYNSSATNTHAGEVIETFVIGTSLLQNGQNVLAIHGLNHSAGDNDFLMRPTLIARQIQSTGQGYLLEPTPGAINGATVQGFTSEPTVDRQRGFYEAAFNVTLAASQPGSSLIYTTDGSQPTRTNGAIVLPASANDLVRTAVPVTTTTTLRAIAIQDGFADSQAITETFLFLADVIQQPVLPDGMPTSWAGATADYEMDPDVVTDPAYRDEIIDGLKSIPSLSIVTDFDHLWDSESGIYIHSTQRGPNWERPVSLELILPDGSTGFQVNAGIRMWGTGWAPHSSSNKHSFQLKFKSEYGPSRLDYPLFSDTPISAFDDIVLRAQGSRSWFDFRNPDISQSQYIRDAWARDTAAAMGKLEGHATFVHLYLNGLYWGLYNPVERTNEKFGEAYLGGDADEYDVINKRSGQTTHATSGNIDAWNEMFRIANSGLETAEAYAEIQQYLDVDDFIDYMLIQQYATNHDGPDQGGNNMRAIRRRNDDGRFTFHVWDMEYTLWYQDEHRNIDGDVADSPMRLFSRLRENAEFRLRYADRVQIHLFGEGALTPAKAAARWELRANEIESAIIGESARWGDGRRATPYTRDVEWTAERQRLLNEYFPQRTGILLQQLIDAGLYSPIEPPALNATRDIVPTGFELNASAPAGTVYLTTNGTDPRLPSGEVDPSAMKFTPRQVLADSSNQVTWTVPNETTPANWFAPEFLPVAKQWSSAQGPIGFGSNAEKDFSPVTLQNATATFSELRRPVGNTIDGDLAGRGWGFSQPVDFQGPVIRSPIAVWETSQDVSYAEGTELQVTMTHDSLTRGNIGRFRIAVTSADREFFADGLENGGDVFTDWIVLRPISATSAEGATMTVNPDHSILVSDGENRRDTYTIRFVTTLPKITGIRLETMTDPSLPGRRGPGRSTNGNAVLSEFQVAAAPADVSHLLDMDTAEQLRIDMQQQSSALLRIPFSVAVQDPFDRLKLNVQFPDGFVAYLNGTEVARAGVSGTPGFDSLATQVRSGSEQLQATTWDISERRDLLRTGDNVLALQVLHASPDIAHSIAAVQLIGESDLKLLLDRDSTVNARVRTGSDWSALVTRALRVVGDLDFDARVTAADIDLLCAAIEANDDSFDLDSSGQTDQDDVDFLVRQVLQTSYGDANRTVCSIRQIWCRSFKPANTKIPWPRIPAGRKATGIVMANSIRPIWWSRFSWATMPRKRPERESVTDRKRLAGSA
ncbi:MAG: CotH kinase family protein [Pirellulaceae bacterium]